jgi:hypothetical protein
VKTRRGWYWLILVMVAFLLGSLAVSPAEANQRTPTVLTVTPSSPSVESGSSITLTATLKDSEGSPLSGKTIIWRLPDATEYTVGTDVGSLNPTSGVTDSLGQTTTTYTGATPHIGVTIRASFGSFGDDEFKPSGDESYEGATTLYHIYVLGAGDDSSEKIEDATGAPLWIWILMVVCLVASAFIERHLTKR